MRPSQPYMYKKRMFFHTEFKPMYTSYYAILLLCVAHNFHTRDSSERAGIKIKLLFWVEEMLLPEFKFQFSFKLQVPRLQIRKSLHQTSSPSQLASCDQMYISLNATLFIKFN